MNWNGWWVAGWAAILFSLLGYELWSLIDHTTRTPPLTWVICRYSPWYVTLSFIGWLFLHFALRYAHPTYIQHLRTGK
jgi:hypothetical protein